MTPVSPGSSSGATHPTPDPTRATTEAPRTLEVPTVAPLRLALEGSYLALGNAGFPGRAGALFSYRPNSFLGVGLHVDTNFTDQFTGTARLEGIWAPHRYFQIEAAGELGVRALFNQRQMIMDSWHNLNGAGFTFGAELAATVPINDVVGISAFGRFFYSPGGGFSFAGMDQSGPALGTNWSGGDITVGLRLNFYLPGGGPPHRVGPSEPEPRRRSRDTEAGGPPPPPRETLRDFESEVARILESTPATVPPAVPATSDAGPNPGPADGSTPPTSASGDASVPNTPADAATDSAAVATDAAAAASPNGVPREEILALQSEVQALSHSVSSLETEIAAATQIMTDLAIGQEAGQSYHIRIDRLYDGVTDHPPRLDAAELSSFVTEFRAALHNSDQLRLLMRSSSESFGPAMQNNLTYFRRALAQYQAHLPLRAPAGGLSRSSLDGPITQLDALIEEVQNLRSQTESTEPPVSQMTLWRERMGRVREHIDELRPRLTTDQAEALDGLYHRLEGGYTNLTQQTEEARRNWMVSRSLFSYYQNFRAARRPTQALAALRGMREELTGAPESYRRARARNVATLRHVLEDFVQVRSEHPVAAWNESRDLAIEVLHWIDPSYAPPALAAPAPARRGHPRPAGASADTPFRFPARSGEGTGHRDE